MVPLETTHQALATPAVIARIAALDFPLAHLCVELLEFFAETYLRVFGFEAPAVHDPCAVAWLIDPAIVPARPHARGQSRPMPSSATGARSATCTA